jgi:hypothetical protein
MRTRRTIQKAALAGALLTILTAFAPQPKCFASTLPRPAARFLHYFQKSEEVRTPEAREISVWERLVVSLIWASSTPSGGSNSQQRP